MFVALLFSPFCVALFILAGLHMCHSYMSTGLNLLRFFFSQKQFLLVPRYGSLLLSSQKRVSL